MTYRFRASEHLKKPEDFRRVYAARCSSVAGALTTFVARNGESFNRVGLSVSKRHVGAAVYRNRAKRLLREAFRLSKSQLPAGFDIVIVAKSAEMLPLAKLIGVVSHMITEAISRVPPGTTNEPPE